MVELLSPAGEINSFKSAIENGANAIYMGTASHNARVMANNFSTEEYIDCIHYAHIRGVKVYLTLNTLIYESEIEDAMKLLIKLYSHGLDAVIIQDIGLLDVIRNVLPNIEIHASTQMSVHNLKQVKYMESLGFSRVVLARELTLNEIEYISKNSNIELEIFIHGALCVSVSGQCLMSSMIGSRSGNRGRCAGPCRLKYSMFENGKNIYSDRYLLSKKDIFGIDYVHKLIDIGVTSLKIEGRSKSPEYVGLVTDKYRKCIDSSIDEEDRNLLNQMFIRTAESIGYFEKVQAKESITENTPKNTGLKLGNVLAVKNEYVKVKLEEDIDLHDGIEVYSNGRIVSTIVTCIKNEQFVTVNKEMKKGSIVWLGDISKKVESNAIIFKTSSSKLNEEYKNKLTKINRKVFVGGTINIQSNKNINMEVKLNGKVFNVDIEYIPQVSVNKPVDEEYIFNQFSKTIDSSFEFTNLEYNIEDNLFVPVSKLNELRRKVIDKLEASFLINIDVTSNYRKLDEYILNHNELVNRLSNGKLNKTINNSLFIYKYSSKLENKYISDDSDIIYLNISDIRKFELKNIDIVSKYINKKDVYVYIPNVVLSKLDKYIEENLERIVKSGVKGILLGNIGYLDLCIDLKAKYKLTIIADYSLNIANTYAAIFFKEKGIDKISILPELDEYEVKNIANVIDVEIVEDYVTAMTSRFCPVKSYSGGCNCTKNTYVIKDMYNNVPYDIVCDNTDCIVKLVRNIPNTYSSTAFSKRKCII
ncbi:MAG: U32 family peptidase [Clostridia bacterium]|nr:U32 family peptidase [Clostridia bacterium]